MQPALAPGAVPKPSTRHVHFADLLAAREQMKIDVSRYRVMAKHALVVLAAIAGTVNAQVGGRGSMIAQDGEISRASGAMYGMMPHVASDRMGFSAFGDSAHDSSLPFNNPDPYYLDNAEAMQDVSASGRDAYQPAGAVCGMTDCADPCPEPCPCKPCGETHEWRWGDDDIPFGKPKVDHGEFHGFPQAHGKSHFHHKWGADSHELVDTITGKRGTPGEDHPDTDVTTGRNSTVETWSAPMSSTGPWNSALPGGKELQSHDQLMTLIPDHIQRDMRGEQRESMIHENFPSPMSGMRDQQP